MDGLQILNTFAVDLKWPNPQSTATRVSGVYDRLLNKIAQSPQAIMRTAPETGGLLHMFKSGSKFCIWNHMDEITKSRILGESLEILRKKNIGGLKLKNIA
jgi:hypothetical protein